MTSDEIVGYLSPAIVRILNVEYATVNTAKELEKLLGITEYTDYYLHDENAYRQPMSEELKKLLVMLAGPHGKTILKAYRIQRGLE